LAPLDARFTKEEWWVDLRKWLAEDIMDELSDTLDVDAEHRQDTNLPAQRIREGRELLNDPIRLFVKEGDLIIGFVGRRIVGLDGRRPPETIHLDGKC